LPLSRIGELTFRFRCGNEAKIPDTFLRGPDQSVLHLRRLKLHEVSLTSTSGFLLSTTALTELSLRIDTAFGSSAETSLLACLQGMPCLGHLDLSILSNPLLPPSWPTPKDIVPLSKLIYFRYVGYSIFLDALVAGLSAPSLLDVQIDYHVKISPRFVHLSRFINDIEEHYHAAHVSFKELFLSLLTQSEYISHCNPRFKLGSTSSRSTKSIIQMSGALSTMLTSVEELRVTFDDHARNSMYKIPWRMFLQQFPNLKALRTEGTKNYRIARSLLQNHEEPVDDPTFLPSLEEIKIDKVDESRCGLELAAFQRFVSARQQAGRPVKLLFGP
jgi:hypothetical protein